MKINSIQNSSYYQNINKNQTFGHKLPAEAKLIIISDIERCFGNNRIARDKRKKALNAFYNKTHKRYNTSISFFNSTYNDGFLTKIYHLLYVNPNSLSIEGSSCKRWIIGDSLHSHTTSKFGVNYGQTYQYVFLILCVSINNTTKVL